MTMIPMYLVRCRHAVEDYLRAQRDKGLTDAVYGMGSSSINYKTHWGTQKHVLRHELERLAREHSVTIEIRWFRTSSAWAVPPRIDQLENLEDGDWIRGILEISK